jgi:hypothetical protein
LSREERIQTREQNAPEPGEKLRKGWRRTIDQLDEFNASQRASHVNRLQRQVSVKIECTWIEEIARGARAQKSLDAIPGSKIIGH